jgi:hypothetical protein
MLSARDRMARARKRRMYAKKLMVGSVTAVTLTLFTGAIYAQQLAVAQEGTAQTSITRREEGVRPDAQATRAGIGAGGAAQFRRSGHRSAEPPGLDRGSRPTRLLYRYANASAVEKSESSFRRWSHAAHQAGCRTPKHARLHV